MNQIPEFRFNRTESAFSFEKFIQSIKNQFFKNFTTNNDKG